jgi:streptogramin lyase
MSDSMETVTIPLEARSEARKRMTPEELEAGYRAMAADEEGEAEAREWVNAYLGEYLPQTARAS